MTERLATTTPPRLLITKTWAGLRWHIYLFDIPTLLYINIWIGLFLWHWQRVPLAPFYIGLLALLESVILLWMLFPPRWWLARVVRYFYLVFYVPLFFTALHYWIPAIRPQSLDAWFIQADRFLLGVHPTVFLERWASPLLTEYLQWCYTTFYFWPPLVALPLLARRRWAELDYFITLVSTGFFLSYFGYLIFPALGPRFFLAHEQNFPLQGLWTFHWIQNTLNALENIQWDAFPSGHTAIVVLILLFTYYRMRGLYYLLLPLGISLIFSTVYLRYHYVVDVLAGLVLVGITHAVVYGFIRILVPNFRCGILTGPVYLPVHPASDEFYPAVDPE